MKPWICADSHRLEIDALVGAEAGQRHQIMAVGRQGVLRQTGLDLELPQESLDQSTQRRRGFRCRFRLRPVVEPQVGDPVRTSPTRILW